MALFMQQKKLEACVLKDVRERFLLASAPGSGGDPEIPDHNNLEDEESSGIRGTFRGRSSRIMRKSSRSSKSSSAAPSTNPIIPDLSDVIFGDAFGL